MARTFTRYLRRVQSRLRREISRRSARRLHRFTLSRPIISFSFDDFPRNAATTGARILKQFEVSATYYVSLGLAGTEAPTGLIFERNDLRPLVADGHELGCHTFDHRDAWDTDAQTFADSLDRNRTELSRLLPGLAMQTMSYPINCPNPGVKRAAAKRFAACRGGGQTFNSGVLDRNDLKAFFLEKSREDLDLVLSLIARNREANGWLVFATHDISDSPTPYGCLPGFFESLVRAAVNSGAEVLPVGGALERVLSSPLR